MVESYLSVLGEFENEVVIERSRFICKVKRVEGESEAKAFIDEVRKAHSDATHNCYAYVASEDGNLCKFSDDGEPQGTAGMPMLDVLKNKKLCMTAAVVTRYFGGIKLGAGGLVRAYSGCVASCLNGAEVVSNELSTELNVELNYDIYPAFLKFVAGKKVKILNSDFGGNVRITCVLPRVLLDGFVADMRDALLGKLDCKPMGEYFYHY